MSGETLVLILDYAGPAIATFTTLRSAEASPRGPVRAALVVAGQAHGQSCGDALRRVAHDGCLDDLPPAWRRTDEQQRGILAAMADSDAPVHVIHARAGCGSPPSSGASYH